MYIDSWAIVARRIAKQNVTDSSFEIYKLVSLYLLRRSTLE